MERYRTTIILLALLVVLGGLALFLNNRNNATTGTPTPEPAQYVWQEEDLVNAIEVVSGTSKVSLRKDVTTTLWTVTEPVQKEADSFAVSSIADSLKSPQATAQYTATQDLAQYGLDKPGMSVTATFSDTQATKRAMMVGSATYNGAGYYVKLPDSATVYVVSNNVIEPLRTWLTTPPVAPPTATPLPVTVVVTGTSTITGTTVTTSTAQPATSPPAGTTDPAETSEPAATPSEMPEASPAAGTPTAALEATTTISGVSPITNTTTQPGAANPTTPVTSPAVPPASPVATPAATP